MKNLKYWKNNCEEDYIKTPISVLRYITELENKRKKQFFIYDVMRSNLALLWWGWCTVWGIIGFIVGCIKLWNYYA
jgi:hypothetical protein